MRGLDLSVFIVFLCRAGLAAHGITRHSRLAAAALVDHVLQKRFHAVAGLFADHFVLHGGGVRLNDIALLIRDLLHEVRGIQLAAVDHGTKG